MTLTTELLEWYLFQKIIRWINVNPGITPTIICNVKKCEYIVSHKLQIKGGMGRINRVIRLLVMVISI